MNIPTLTEAERLLSEAEAKNPGGWADHARYVALAAKNIAAVHPELDAETAYILGLLHDVGRQEGSYGMKHILDGYTFMPNLGLPTRRASALPIHTLCKTSKRGQETGTARARSWLL